MATKNLHVGIKVVILVKCWHAGGYLKVREYLCTRVIIWVNIFLSHIDSRGDLT